MKQSIFVFIIICFLLPSTTEAKKKAFGNGLFWELERLTLTISGTGQMPDYSKKKKAPWSGKKREIFYIIIEDGVTSIGDYAFYFDDNWSTTLSSVSIPNSVVSIGEGAFANNTYLSKVEIPNSVKVIGKGAFNNTSIPSIIIPNSVISIGDIAFGLCKKLETVVLPDSLKIINFGLFAGCKNLSSISIPHSVKNIEDMAFSGCSSLTAIKIPNSVVSIGYEAFYGCSSLTAIEIPNSVTQLGRDLFTITTNSGISLNFKGEILELPQYVINSDNPEQWGISKESITDYKEGVHNKEGRLILSSKEADKVSTISYENKNFYLIKKGNKDGIIDDEGRWIIPLDYYGFDYLGNGFLRRINSNGFYSVLNIEGKEIISSDRCYTWIGDYDKENERFPFSMKRLTGYCNAQGEEISVTRLAPTANDIKEDGGYSEVESVMNNNVQYYKVKKGRLYGLTDIEGKVIVPCEMEALESAGTGYLRYKMNGFWGLMNYQLKILIDTDRGYTSIGDYRSFNKRFAYTMDGYKGECDVNGRQISKIKVDTPKQNTSVASSTGSSSSSTSSSSSSSSINNSSNSSTTIHVEHHRDPVPVQEWQQCNICYGSGNCGICGGNGWNPYSYANGRYIKCISCGGNGRCSYCAGRGGRNITVYR